MSEIGAKQTPGREMKDHPAEILRGSEAMHALSNVAALLALIRHHAEFNFSGPPINPSMKRDEVARILELYGYPPSILTQEQVASGIGEMAAGFSHRLQEASSSPAYDVMRFQAEVAADREAFEAQGYWQVDALAKEGNMVAAKVDGKTVGMLGMRKLGRMNDRQVYEHLKASVLSDYEGRGIFSQMKQKAVELNCEEAGNPLWVVHSKNPKVVGRTERFEGERITFEDYARLRGWTMPPSEMEKVKEKWALEGWQYFLVDFRKQAEAAEQH